MNQDPEPPSASSIFRVEALMHQRRSQSRAKPPPTIASAMWWRLWLASGVVIALAVLAWLAPVPGYVRATGVVLEHEPALRVELRTTASSEPLVRAGDPARLELGHTTLAATVVETSGDPARIVVEVPTAQLAEVVRPIPGSAVAVRLSTGSRSALAYVAEAFGLAGGSE